MEVLRERLARSKPVRAPTPQAGASVAPSLEQIRDWCNVAARAAWAKGGEDTIILSVGEVLAITDAFVITSGTNPRQVRTIAEEVEERLKQVGGPAPLRIEGLDDARWVLMDFGDFVVHVMLTDVRDFYQLERLWADSDVWSWRQDEALASGE
jgi:ribosome-associated protein